MNTKEVEGKSINIPVEELIKGHEKTVAALAKK